MSTHGDSSEATDTSSVDSHSLEAEPQGKGKRRPSVNARDVVLEPLPDPALAPVTRPGNGGREPDGTDTLSTVPDGILDAVRRTREAARASESVAAVAYPADVVQAVEREWLAGIRSVTAIAKAYELPRTTILAWAKRHDWGPRDDARRDAVRSAITSALIERTAQRVAPIPGDDGSPSAVMTTAHVAANPEEAAQAMVDDYAAVVANVVQRMRDTSGMAVDTGRTLLAEYQSTMVAVMNVTRGDRAKAMKALASLAATYKTVVAALSTAYQLQRQSYGLDAHADDRPPGAGPEALGGTYEDAVREAEERGIALDS